MSYSTIAKTIDDGTIVFSDLADTNSYTIVYEDGNLSINIPERTVIDIYDRNDFMTPRYGKRQKITGSFSCHMTDLVDNSYVTPADLFLRSGAVASWNSRYGANAEVFAYKILFTISGTDHGDASDHTMTIDNVVITSFAFAEGDPNKLTFNFEARPSTGNRLPIVCT